MEPLLNANSEIDEIFPLLNYLQVQFQQTTNTLLFKKSLSNQPGVLMHMPHPTAVCNGI